MFLAGWVATTVVRPPFLEGPEYLSRKGFEALKSTDSKPPAGRPTDRPSAFRLRKRGTLHQKRTISPCQIFHVVAFFFKYFIGKIRSVFEQMFSLGKSAVFLSKYLIFAQKHY